MPNTLFIPTPLSDFVTRHSASRIPASNIIRRKLRRTQHLQRSLWSTDATMPHDGFLAQVIEAKRPVGKDRGENTEPANQAMIMMIGRPQLLLGILACYFFRGERKALGNEVSEVREKGGPAGEGRSSNQKTKRAAWRISGYSQQMRGYLGIARTCFHQAIIPRPAFLGDGPCGRLSSVAWLACSRFSQA